MDLDFDKKIEEYETWVLTHGKAPTKKEKIKFSDGIDMHFWIYNYRRYIGDFLKEIPEEALPERYQNFVAMCRRIETLSDGKIQLTIRNDGMASRIEQYMEKARELGRRPLAEDNLCFRDGKNMVNWYHICNRVYGKTPIESDLTEEDKNNLPPFVKMKMQLLKEEYYNTQLWKVLPLTFEKRTKEYLDYFCKNKKMPNPERTFSDGIKMLAWYRHQLVLIRSERKKKQLLSKVRLKEIQLFARMENEILKVKDLPGIRKVRMSHEEKMKYFIEKISKKEFCLNRKRFQFPDGTSVANWVSSHPLEVMDYLPKSLSLEERILEYWTLAKKEGKKLNTRDPRRFSDYYKMAPWLMNEETKVRKERKNNSLVSNLRMGELYALALLDDALYTLERYQLSSKEKESMDDPILVKRLSSSL